MKRHILALTFAVLSIFREGYSDDFFEHNPIDDINHILKRIPELYLAF